MADKKISQLTAATTPLAGTEVLPIVQGGSTVKVPVSDLTAGRAVSVLSATLSGGTVNGVLYLNASKVATSGSALVFDGTNLGIGTSSPGTRLDVVGANPRIRLTPSTGTQDAQIRVVNTGGITIFGRDDSTGSNFGAAYGTVLWSTGAYPMQFATNDIERARITANGSFVAGAQVALATTATDGFLYVPTCAGTPTGTPTAITGMAPIVVNTTNNKLYFYSGGQWRDAGP
jgi:hypothetical protein